MDETRPRRLAEWMRSRLTDGQRFLVLCIVAGGLCGLAAVAFHLSLRGLFHMVWEFARGMDPVWFVAVMLGAPTAAGLVVGVAVRFFAPDAAGSGIPQTKEAYYNKGGNISLVAGVWRFCLGVLYVGLGNSLGREGPTVHFCSAISSRIGRWAFRDPARVQAMLPVGAAAGIAASFNAPLSALTFVFEELLDNFSMKAMGGMVIAVVISAAVARTLLGEDPVLPATLAQHYETSAWMLVALPLGLAAGFLGHGFSRGLLLARKWCNTRRNLPAWLRPATGGFACGVLGLAGFYLTGLFGQPLNSVFSIGYESLELAFASELVVPVMAILLVLKFTAVLLNYATGGSGGLFSPTLLFGGMLGGIIGAGLVALQQMWHWIPGFPDDAHVIGGCVLLGMGAMFGSIIRCPFTSLFIIFEMTGNYSLILPLMGGNVIAWQIARRLQPVGIYTGLLLQDGVSLRKLPAYRGAQDYGKLPVQAIMTRDVVTLPGTATLAEAAQRIAPQHDGYHAYPVVDEAGRLTGIMTRSEILHGDPASTLDQCTGGQRVLAVHPETPIRDAANQMISRKFQQVPVVSPLEPQTLLGWLTLNDIARQQNAVEE